ncbi:MAG: ABC transporter substrate-binding protein [Gammaproteobacteria bacterium]|nr:ABC transporter substrate-binding protein [Gammaproteobacteria bacterium]
MKTVECGIKAFDAHELLCHFVARRCGFYESAGLDVRLRDTSFTPDDSLPGANYFQVACGAALLSRNVRFRVVLAAVARPMFWLYGAARISAVEQLAGKRIATFPPPAPPYLFNRIVLRKHGLDPDTDVELKPARDDAIRLGLLREGAVDAALISSAVAPVAIQGLGLNLLTMLGDELTVVTSGLATTEKIASEDPGLVATLVNVYRQSLAVIHDSPAVIHSILEDIMSISHEDAVKTRELILPCYTPDGYVDAESLQAGLADLGAELGMDILPDAGEIYKLQQFRKQS